MIEVYQLANHGTKAVVTVHGESGFSDAWFWWDRVTEGTTLAVALTSGYGPHTHRNGVIYIGSQEWGSGVYDSVSARTVKRAQCNYRRTASSSGRHETWRSRPA